MWRISGNSEAVEIDGDWLVLDGEQYVVTRLNETGGWIWSRLKEGATLDMLIRAMTEEYEVDSARAKEDITVFINHLTACGLVEHVA